MGLMYGRRVRLEFVDIPREPVTRRVRGLVVTFRPAGPPPIVIENLHIDFQVTTGTAGNTPGRNTITIHNLSRQNQAEVEERAGGQTRVVLSAGYEDCGMSVLFDGIIMRTERSRENLALKTILHLGYFYTAAPMMQKGTTTRSYDEAVSPLRIIEDIVGGDMGLALGPLPETLLDLPDIENWSWERSSMDALSDLLNPRGFQWYEENGTIRIAQITEEDTRPQDDLPAIVLSPQNGLVGSPTKTIRTVKARSLLNPLMVPGCEIDLQSDLYAGRYCAFSVRHHGSNWTGSDFYTELEMVPAPETPATRPWRVNYIGLRV